MFFWRTQAGLLKDLFENKLLSKDVVEKGLSNFLEVLEDEAIDNPNAPKVALSLTHEHTRVYVSDLQRLSPARSLSFARSLSHAQHANAPKVDACVDEGPLLLVLLVLLPPLLLPVACRQCFHVLRLHAF